VLSLVIAFPDLPLLLRTQVPPEISEEETVTKEFSWTATGSPGRKTASIVASDDKSTTANRQFTVQVLPAQAAEQATGDGNSGDDGERDSGGSEDETETPPARQARSSVFQPESIHKVEGPYSGIVTLGSGRVAKLAANTSILSKQVRADRADYWLDIRARHDRPGPVDLAVYVNNTAWKVIRLDRADNQFRTHRVGLLRDFTSATIQFRLLNDDFDRADPANEDKDRNLFIDWWRLTTDDSAPANEPARPVSGMGGGSTASSGTRSAGWQLLPELNRIVREELGAEFVTVDTWRYYAQRLAAPTNHRASIQTEAHLRTVMRYWQGVQPDRPRGEPFLQ
jgi:hypothetical protein